MDIRARLYPHPVLTSYSDDYIDSEFSFNVNIENTDNDIRLKFNIILDNEELQYLINNNSAEYVIHIECTQTCYRKIIHTGEILSTAKNVQHNISNMGQIVNLYGICNTSEGVYFPLPRLDNQNLDHFIALSINNTAIIIEAGNDANFADSYVVVEYIKNND